MPSGRRVGIEMLISTDEARSLILSGKALVISGQEELLRELPEGQWLGGTIPYFMSKIGGVICQERVFVQELPEETLSLEFKVYSGNQLTSLVDACADSDFSLVLVPAFSRAHERYALEAPHHPRLSHCKIAGFVAGIHLGQVKTHKPTVFLGSGERAMTDELVAVHAKLQPGYSAQLGIVNIFTPQREREFRFTKSGFVVSDCLIHGEPQSFYDYLLAHRINLEFPLICSYGGSLCNVSFFGLDHSTRSVKLYAPVFSDRSYYFAAPLDNYAEAFSSAIPPDLERPFFACNCILNFLYGKLEGRQTGRVLCPMSFGELGPALLNQTLVHLSILANSPD